MRAPARHPRGTRSGKRVFFFVFFCFLCARFRPRRHLVRGGRDRSWHKFAALPLPASRPRTPATRLSPVPLRSISSPPHFPLSVPFSSHSPPFFRLLGLLREVEEGEEHAEDDSDASIRGISRGYELKSSAESPDDFESNTELCLRILKQRVLSNPMVITATAAIFVSMIVKHKDRNAKLPYIIDQTSLYLNNCVLGVSLFNFGLFAHLNGVVSCEPAEAGLVLLGRFVLSPLMNIPVMYFFGMRWGGRRPFATRATRATCATCVT